jgi:CDP-paratose 2-epimerase
MKWIVTGACGFIGTNAVTQLVEAGDTVVGLDALTRPLMHRNLSQLRDSMGVEIRVADVRDRDAVDAVLSDHSDADAVLHLAGQVSLLASIENPRFDMETNINGTFNVLESTRRHAPDAAVIYSSTNKVYGDLGYARLEEGPTRWTLPGHPDGVDEHAPLDFHGGYGCSKGAADQFVLDHHRSFGLRGVSLRQSSIYGGDQWATADQGWIAYFAWVAVTGERFAINGDGKQVRDALHVDDLVRLYRACAADPDVVAGEALNIGGGMDRSSSLIELFARLEDRYGFKMQYDRGPERPSDQKVFVADTSKAQRLLGWDPTVSLDEGLDRLVLWTQEHRHG